MANGVRFARIHGRIIPIREKGHQGDPRKDYKQSAAIGAAGGAAMGAASAIMQLSKSKSAFAIGAAASTVGAGLGLYGLGRGIYQTANQKKGKRARTFFGHYFSQTAGNVGGTIAGMGVAAAGVGAVRYGRQAVKAAKSKVLMHGLKNLVKLYVK